MIARALQNPLQKLLASSLVLWGVHGWVIVRGPQEVVVHIADGGAQIRVARLSAGHPMRWRVEAEDGENRTCLSIVGALSAVRGMLDVIAGAPLCLSPVRSDA